MTSSQEQGAMDTLTPEAVGAVLTDEADPILRRRAGRALAGLATGGGE